MALTRQGLHVYAASAGLNVIRSIERGGWFVFDANTAELRGYISETMTLREAAAQLAKIAGEMGSLYALADEARFANPGAKA